MARRPPGFAFVEFEDPRDAEDAVGRLNDTEVDGRRIRVEVSGGREFFLLLPVGVSVS